MVIPRALPPDCGIALHLYLGGASTRQPGISVNNLRLLPMRWKKQKLSCEGRNRAAELLRICEPCDSGSVRSGRWVSTACGFLNLSGELSGRGRLFQLKRGPTSQFDEGQDGGKHDHQGNGAEAKLKNQAQHPCEHEKHEDVQSINAPP
jgi:hypothetical protein